MSKYSIRVAGIFVMLLVPAMLLAGCETGKPTPTPANLSAVIIDRSASFNARQPEAVAKSIKYLEDIAGRKHERWQGKADKVAVISLDAMPSILWEGSPDDLKTVSSNDWTKRFDARTDFAKCSDVSGAFTLAAEWFARSNGEATSKYLLAYTDMLHEPPLNSASNCAKPLSGPSQDFPWDSLDDVSVTVFWMPINQKLIWQRAAHQRGFSNHFALYSDSESGAVNIAAPPEATRTMSDVERVKAAQQFKSQFTNAARVGGALVGGIFVLVIVMAIVARRRTPQGRVIQAGQVPLTPAQIRARNARNRGSSNPQG